MKQRVTFFLCLLLCGCGATIRAEARRTAVFPKTWDVDDGPGAFAGAQNTQTPSTQTTLAKVTTRKVRVPATVLVMELRGVGPVAEHLPKVVTRLLLGALAEVEGLTTSSSDDVQAMLAVERQKDLAGCVDTSCAAEIGGALGAATVLYGDISAIGSQFSVNLTVVDAAKARVSGRVSRTFSAREDDIPGNIPSIRDAIVDALNSPR